jgi:hypothetical protein
LGTGGGGKKEDKNGYGSEAVCSVAAVFQGAVFFFLEISCWKGKLCAVEGIVLWAINRAGFE